MTVVEGSPLRRAAEGREDGFYVGSKLVDRCGGIDALEAMDSAPLKRHELRWDIVPVEDHELVGTLLSIFELVCPSQFDNEYLTVVKRLLEIAAAHPDRPLHARTSPDRLAAALMWIAVVANADPFHASNLGIRRLWYAFDVTSCTKLARKMATMLGFRPPPRYGEEIGWKEDAGVYLRDPQLLVGESRLRLIEWRDDLNQWHLDQREQRRLARPVVRDGGEVRMALVPTEFTLALRTSIDSGRQVIALGLGGEMLDPDSLYAFSIPEAQRLVAGVQRALHSVASDVSLAR